jgi:hypothetical protein
VLRHVNTGAFEVYDLAGLGQVGSAVRRFSPDGLERLIGDSGGPLSSQPANGLTSQVVHAMPASATIRPIPRLSSAFGADTSQQTFLTPRT